MVLMAFADIRPAASSGNWIVVKDGSIEATIGRTVFGIATRTSPAPARRADRPARAAAPLIPTLPAMMATLETQEVVKIITGIGKPARHQLLLVDTMECAIDRFELRR